MKIGTQEWFEERAKEAFVYNEKEGFWDFADSLLAYGPKSAELYEALQKEDSSYKENVTSEEHEFLQYIAPSIVEDMGDIENFIDLGPGTEHKEDYLLKEFEKLDKKPTYIPVDVNEEMLSKATDHVREMGFEVKPILGTFEDLHEKIKDVEGLRFVSLGLTYINYKPEEINNILGSLMGENGFAFINTQKADENTIETLKHEYMGEGTFGGGMFRLQMGLIGLDKSDYVLEATNDIEVWATIKTPSALLIEKGIKEGDRVLVFRTLRHDPDTLEQVLLKEFNFIKRYNKQNSSFTGFLLKK